MQIVLIALLALSGVGQTVQDALNAQLRTAVKSPLLGALVSLLVGSVVLGLLTLFGVLGRGKPSAVVQVPVWIWAGGGILGAYAVTMGLIGIPKVSAGVVIAATVFGQITAAIIVDHFGWLGVPKVPITPWRIVGAVGLFISVLLVQKK